MSDLNSLLPARRSVAPVLVPLVILVLLIVGSVYAFLTFVQPLYVAGEVSKQEQSEVLSSVAGFTVTEKLVEGDCLKLVLKSDSEGYSLCAPEEVWAANEVDEPFTDKPLTNENEK